MDGRKKAADMYTALAYTHKSLNRHLVYRAGHVSVATQQHIADIQAEKALAALSLKVEGTPPTPTPNTGWDAPGRKKGAWGKPPGENTNTGGGKQGWTSTAWVPAPSLGWGKKITPKELGVPPSDTSQTTPHTGTSHQETTHQPTAQVKGFPLCERHYG